MTPPSGEQGPGDRVTACELFNAAAEAFGRSDLTDAVTVLRGAFFENIYVAPLLLREEHHPQKIWYAGAEGEPSAAREYVKRYGRVWYEGPRALEFLAVVWRDPLVRAELKSFLNLSRNLLSVRTESDRDDLLRERDRFLNPERLKRTQSEILARVERAELRLRLPKPHLGLVLLAAREPAESVEFYRKLLAMEPVTTSRTAGGYAEFEISGIHLAIHGQDRPAAGDPYRLGPPPDSLGWGSVFVIRVVEFERYHANALAAGIEILDSDLTSAGRRFFVVKDPSGYVLEITEEDPKGLEPF